MLCGLEIHQRLAGHKLFNNCPTPSPNEKLDEKSEKIIRTLNLASSELGKVDIAAEFEVQRRRTFEYSAPPQHSCLVDSDEEPPGELNPNAFLQVLKFAKHVNANIVDEIQVMRKTVIDGSNTSGFQRTALVATGGKLKYSEGSISLSTICIEEESAGILPPSKGRTSYRLDRLGIPLIEIATEPVFTSPQQAAAGAEALGLALRMIEGVMRGLGTIRQDVNISTPKGARVEIKGLQSLKLLSLLVENEVKRQEKLIEIINEIKKRVKGNAPKIQPVNLTPIFKNSFCKITKKAISSGGVVLAAKLPSYAGLLGKELYTGRRFGSELADYAKSAGGVKGLLHSDENLQGYGFSLEEITNLKKKLGANKEDAVIIIADSREKAENAINAAIKRALFFSIPEETRKADANGGSSFMRPLAGAHRMYPETDVRPIKITSQMLQNAGKLDSLEEKRKKLAELLGPQLGVQMLRSRNLPLFEKLNKKYAEPKLIAITLEQTLVSLRREGISVEKINETIFDELFLFYEKGKITKASISEILKYSVGRKNAEEIIDERKLQKISGEELKKLWKKEGKDMRSFMAEYRLVVDAKEVMKISSAN
ncbi:MAG: Glu-tRNA(Gln) amidotransferase subunit GatE [Candidatus Micrarchaeota archaeon]